MRDLLPIICSGQASKGGRIQLIHGSRPRGVRSRPPDARGVATPRASAQTLIRSGLTDHARGIERSEMGPRCSAHIRNCHRAPEREAIAPHVRSHLAPPDPHPAPWSVRTTPALRRAIGPPSPARGNGSDNPLLLIARLERGAQDVAERRARIGGAILGDRLLLLGHFQRLDRHRDLTGATVELDDAGIDLLADREALGTLIAAVAREFRALDECGEVSARELDFDAAVLDLEHFAGHDRALTHLALARVLAHLLGRERIAGELLDAERDALLLDIDIEHHGAYSVALLELVDHLLARTRPVEVREMHHAVDVAVEADEQAEFGLVLDLALDRRADRMFLREGFPRILQGLLQAERDAALGGIDLEHLNLDLLAGRDDLAGMDVLLGPGHFGDVDQSLDARLQLDEGAVVGDVGHAAAQPLADRVAGFDRRPRVFLQLLHTERDAVRLVVDLDDADLDRLADAQHLGRMVDAAPGDVGDVQKAVDAAEVHERAVVGDVLDCAVNDLALGEIGDDLMPLLGAALFQHGAARDDDVAAAAIHFQNLERLRDVHQRRDVAHRADVDLAARQERHRAVEIDGEAALDLVEDDAVDLLALLERLLELDPAFLSARLVARDDGFPERVLDTLEIDLDLVSDLRGGIAAVISKFLKRDPTL